MAGKGQEEQVKVGRETQAEGREPSFMRTGGEGSLRVAVPRYLGRLRRHA